MKPNRRHFLKSITAAGATMAAIQAARARTPAGKTAVGLATPKMDKVRWAFIGVGARGSGHLGTILMLENAEVAAICDNHPATLKRGLDRVAQKTGKSPAAFGGDGNPEAWKKMLERDDIDAVIISTPWELHAPQAVACMEAGKHAFIEVPAALTVEECWQLVDTAERTQRHCMMMENVNYGREELMLLNMVRQGLFGELLHGEAAYIHELRGQMHQVEHGTGSWRTPHYAHDQGNLYPTHGLGPVAHYMDICRGDYFDHMVSMSTPARGRELFAKANFPAGHKWNQFKEWKCGDLSTSLIKCVSGRTLMVQWDEPSPRPYSRHNYVQGTKGAFGGFPNRIAVDYSTADLPEPVRAAYGDRKRSDFHSWDTNMEPWYAAYDHPLWRRVGEIAAKHGGHGGMDYIMIWRMQDCLLNGEPMDQSVYDAALWSVVTPLSRASVENGSAPQKFPDFTRGQWKSTPPLPIVGA
jgi:hypothetical protein